MHDKEAIISVSKALTYYAGGVTSTFSFWTWVGENTSQITAVAAMGGLVVTVLAFCVNWYYRHKEYKNNTD